jgi:hypothetical protein
VPPVLSGAEGRLAAALLRPGLPGAAVRMRRFILGPLLLWLQVDEIHTA